MEPQRQKRRAIPLRLSHSSSPDSTEQQQTHSSFASSRTRPGVESNTYDSPTPVLDTAYGSADDQDVQIKRLQSRQTRFRALSIVPRRITPAAVITAPMNNEETHPIDHPRSSPFDAVLQPPVVLQPSNDLGILQEVSNSSLPRKRSHVEETPSLFEFSDDQRRYDDYTQPQAYRNLEARLAPIAAAYPTITANSSLPLRVDPARTPRARKGLSRGGSPRKPSHEDTPRYIEQLESQIAALQTQLQTLQSPSTTKGHSAKLRAMTAESRQLRQEVDDWERKFHDRISEQFGQHEMVVASLKSQIRTLQRELDISRERVKDMVTQCAEKDRQIIAAEGANYDLERRLEFMSELLALSPTKLSFDSETPQERTRISAPRPSSGQFRLPIAGGLKHVSQQRPASSRPSTSGMSPESPTKRDPRTRHSQEINPFEHMRADVGGTEPITDAESVASASAPGSARIPFSGRRSINGSLASDDETKTRPTRRMRRFYTGSMGPRSLILPGATNYESQPWSTPTGAQTPQFPPSSAHTPSQLHGLGFKLPISPERRPAHLRAATWDENEGSARKERRTTTAFTPLPLIAPPEFLAQSPVESTPMEGSAELLPTHNRVTSLTMIPTRNLFEELSRMHREGRGISDKVDMDSASASASAASMVRGEQSSLSQNPATHVDEAAVSFTPAHIHTTLHDLASSPELEEVPPRRAPRPRSWIPAADITPIFDDDATPMLLQDFLPAPPETVVEPDQTLTLPALDLNPPEFTTKRQRPLSWIPAPHEPLPIADPPTPPQSSQTPNMTSRVLAFLTYTLAPSTPAIRAVLQNAWSLVTLSRPVLEFRWWLVRLLVGGLQRKRRLKLLATGATSSPKPKTGVAKTVAPGAKSTSVQSTATFAVMRGLGISTTQKLLTCGIDGDRSYTLYRTVSGSSAASTATTIAFDAPHVVGNGRSGEAAVAEDELEDAGISPPRREFVGDKASLIRDRGGGHHTKSKMRKEKEREEETQLPRPVAWLKLSMTLVFAVGVAIRDGPASLFKPVCEIEDYAMREAESPRQGVGRVKG